MADSLVSNGFSDGAGRVDFHVLARIITSDSAGRPLTWFEAGRHFEATYLPSGRLRSISGASETQTFYYDAAGALIGIGGDHVDTVMIGALMGYAASDADGSLISSVTGSPISVAAAIRFPTTAVSGGTISLDSAHICKVISITTGASDSAVTLPVVAADGDVIITRKADSGAGKANINSDTAWLMTVGDVVQWQYNGSAWWPLDWRITPTEQLFPEGGNYIRPPLSVDIVLQLLAAAAGGGSGRRGAAGTVRCGGGAGQAGGYTEVVLSAALLGPPLTSVPVNVGVGGNGGAAVTVDDTNGVGGAIGGDTSFGPYGPNNLYVTAGGGAAGAGGTASSGTSGTTRGAGTTPGVLAPNASNIGAANNAAPQAAFGGCGSPGGGITSANATSTGAAGGTGGVILNALAGGTANGGNGQSQPTDFANGFTGGSGGGGGNSSATGGTNGGNGGWPGAAGGGGGATLNGFDSGAGGMGADGAARCLTMY